MTRKKGFHLIVLVITAASVVVPGTAGFRAGQEQPPPNAGDLPPFPSFEKAAAPAASLREAYEFAARHPEVLDYVPCYCACGKREGHKSSTDCFVSHRDSKKVTWNAHAVHCAICVQVALDARQMHLTGQDVATIQAAIDRKHLPTSPHRTPTPAPPPR